MLTELRKAATGLDRRAEALLRTDWMGWVILAGGIVLRLRQFAARLSFGNDEAALARNIFERSFSRLTQPLGYHQGAPVLFLFIQRLFLLAFGNKDYVLELFPLVAGCAAIYVFYRIARRHLGIAGLLPTLAFALSVWLVTYSADPKQYSSDVLVALLLIWLADRCLAEQRGRRDFLLLGLGGALAIWLSHPAAFVLPGIGLVILALALRRKDRTAAAWTLALGAAWTASFAADYFVSLRYMTVDTYLQKYWGAYFMPLPPWRHPGWFVDALRALVLPAVNRTDTLVLLIWAALLLLGAVSLLARQRHFGVILLLPFGLTLVAAGLHKYPIWDRLVLWLVPFAYLLAAEAVWRIYAWVARWNRAPALIAYAALALVLLWPMAVAAKRNFFAPPHNWDMRLVVEYMSTRWNAGDVVYVSGGGETFAYYSESYGLHPASLTVEASHRMVRYFQYRSQLAAYAGRHRVWIIFAYFEEGSYNHNRYAKYLNRIGEIHDSFRAGFARAYLCSFDP